MEIQQKIEANGGVYPDENKDASRDSKSRKAKPKTGSSSAVKSKKAKPKTKPKTNKPKSIKNKDLKSSVPRQNGGGGGRQTGTKSLPLEAEENTCTDVNLDLSVQKPSAAPLDPPSESSTQQSKPHPDSLNVGENQKPKPESPSEGKNQESKPRPESSGPVERRKAKPFPDAPTEMTRREDLNPNNPEDAVLIRYYNSMDVVRGRELEAEAIAKAKAEAQARAKALEIPPDKPVTAQNLQELNPKPKPEPKPALNGENPEPKPAKPEEKQDYTHKKLKFEGNWNSLNKIIEIWDVFSAENNEWITRSEDGFHNFLSTYAAVAKKAKLPIYHKKRVKDFYSYFVYLFKNSLDKSVIRRRDEDKAREIKKELFRKDLYPAF